MHELSVAQAIVDTAVRHADGRRVKLVSLRLGSMRQVVPDSLTFYFEIVARDTLCEGAELEHEIVAARLRCPDCDREWDPAPQPVASDGPVEWELALPTFRCADCGTPGEVEAGGELEVESIEVEDAAQATLS
jgi:hydrogenase nickel incorporation protein HypA/HybF